MCGFGYILKPMKNLLIILSLLVISTCAQAESIVPVTLGQQFTLRPGETVKVDGRDLTLRISKFFNSPCPKDAQCIWSGVGVEFEYTTGGQTYKGMALTQAMGYEARIIKSDYTTYADVVVDEIRQ